MRKKVSLTLALLASLALTSGQAQAQDKKKADDGRRPGDGKPLVAPNPAFTLEQARPDDFKPNVGAIAFLPDGKLAVTSFVPNNNGVAPEAANGTLYILENATSKDPSKIVVHKISESFVNPLGMNYINGALYVCDRDEVTKWTDSDNDGLPDKKETLASGWISDNYHHFTFGLPYHDGSFYIALSTNITFDKMIKEENIKGPVHSLNGPNPANRGGLLKIDAKTGEWTVVSGGLRTPNGVSVGPEGNIVIPDNQGAWKPASGIYFAKQGAFFGHYNNTEATSDFYPEGGVPATFSDQPITPPAVWLPQNESNNSPAELIEIPKGQPHAGQFLMAEITLGGINRVSFEKVGDTWQGVVFRHSHGFESGLNRLEWGPDGCLYVGGMGSRGNWGWKGTTFGLQRLRPTGQTPFEYETVQATKDGFRVSFNKPVPQDQLEKLDNWQLNAWTYTTTRNYGGPKVDTYQPQITKAVASADGTSVELTVPDRRPNFVYHFRTDPTSKTSEQLWSTEAWYTFHKAPGSAAAN